MRLWIPTSLPAAALLACGLAGCATPPPASDKEAVADYRQTNDPLEPTNRVLFEVANGFNEVVIRPLAVGYVNAVPGVVRTHVHNVLANLDTPVILVNDMMQGKPHRAGTTLMRMVINTTAGIGGIFDVAAGLGYPEHSSDFGETLAIWGVPEGPFLYLPILGPTDPRDAIGYGIDIALNPETWLLTTGPEMDLEYAQFGLYIIDIYGDLMPDLDKVQEQALDPYATFRSLYRQHRHAQIDAIRNDHAATSPDHWFPDSPPDSQPAQ